MTSYIEEQESIGYWVGDDDLQIVSVLANRYIGANPEIPFAFRAFQTSGMLQMDDGMFNLNLADKLPAASNGQLAYVYGLVWSDSEREIHIGLECLGPLRLYANESLLYRSNVIDEIKPDAKTTLTIKFHKGWNTLLVEAEKTAAGFGCRIGSEEAKVRILNVLAPFTERSGYAGWLYSETVDGAVFGHNGEFPDFRESEKRSGLSWLPEKMWGPEESAMLSCERIFGLHKGQTAYAWSKFSVPLTNTGASLWKGYSAGPATVWLNDVELFTVHEKGEFQYELPLPQGVHAIIVKTHCGDSGWGFTLTVYAEGIPLAFEQPQPVQGSSDPWFYLGPISPEVSYSPSDLQTLYRLFDGSVNASSLASKTYWRLDAPDTFIRPYYENAMLSNKWTTSSVTNYSRWDYPLGVTLYGLLQSGRLLSRSDILAYAKSHLRICTDMYEYSLWDRDAYGFPSINQQLVLMKMLDNCGSIGSAMLEAYMEAPEKSFLPVADRIADFIEHQLERRENGAYYRLCEGEYSANTLWADDLYMSTPFLCRYYKITGNRTYLDDAAKQFLQYRGYLYMPESRLMSHVFDFKYEQATQIPWGRGNGWCLFSLSELLEVLPKEHPDRAELLRFFNDLCAGIAALQSSSGLWHQVLTHPDSYEESSCTAMFAYAFARGVRLGWLADPQRYAAAARKAWTGLTKKAIDKQGNVHGVCSGSRYSFSPAYYKEDLLTVVNDNHGIGIMLLAGVEISKMKSWDNARL